jgi:hypothetical protein
MDEVLVIGADAAQDAEDRLHEERRLGEAPVEEMGQAIEMADVIAFELEAGAMPSPSSFMTRSMSLKVFLKMKSRLPSRCFGSQSYLKLL